MTKQQKIFTKPFSLDQLKAKFEHSETAMLLSADSCIVVTPPLPPGASR